MIKPIKKKVAVKLIDKPKESSGGIILVAADREEANKGEVVAIGEDVTEVAVGDLILPNWNAAQKVVVESEEYFIVEEDDIVLVFEE